ncbi:MAG: adenylate kinase [Ignavibacteria bacterium]
MEKVNILNLTAEELEHEIIVLNEPKYRAEQIFTSLHKNHSRELRNISGISSVLKTTLDDNFFIPVLKNTKITDSKHFVTKKFLFEIIQANETCYIESVLISEKERNTICLSTQVGCNVGCEFCATGKMGFKKNLNVSEIVMQVYEVIRLTGIIPTNIVYMGMGEPFLNYDNMIKSLKILTHPKGLAISSKRITVSTVGFKGKIIKFANDLMLEENKYIKNVKLALSLHSTDNGVRESIIPTSVKNKLPDLYKEISYFYQKTRNKITYEYIHFEGLNDTMDDIKRLEKISRMVPSNINIIPFHPIDFELSKPLDIYNGKKDINKLLSNQKLFDFIAELKRQKVIVNLRSSSGIDIHAACGQLAVIQKESHNIKNMYQLIIFGPPGVGKGTQAELLAKKLNLEHISTGAILRKAFDEGSELGIKAKEIMDKGNLVPDEIMNGIVKENLKSSNKEGFILDGYPRTVKQAEALSGIFDELDLKEIMVITLSVDEKEIIERLLKRGRSDDTEDCIKNRLDIYTDSTKPIIEYFKNKHTTLKVNGAGEIDEINELILSSIEKEAAHNS